ncbi:MAG: 2OG-Fe(II) oxygenase [Pseudomonadales bacterium]|nr:2OG-Fe(II) oxygenase [Pseudomonadales bacterium]
MTKQTKQETSNCSNSQLFERIAQDLQTKGYSINPSALPLDLAGSLSTHIQQLAANKFNPAGIGRKQAHKLSDVVRSDKICWITDETTVGGDWLNWTSELQQFLNRRLFMGLFSFESHFAHYAPGDFYKKHLDAFKGDANRVLSLVVYLNHNWSEEDGGELVMYVDEHDETGFKVNPYLGTVVIFLSEEFPHAVLPSIRDRYSIAGWFRVNTSNTKHVDPPR